MELVKQNDEYNASEHELPANYKEEDSWPLITPSFSDVSSREVENNIQEDSDRDFVEFSEERILRMFESIEFFEEVVMGRDVETAFTRHRSTLKDAFLETEDEVLSVGTRYNKCSGRMDGRIFGLEYDPGEDLSEDAIQIERDYIEREFDNKGYDDSKKLPVAFEDLTNVVEMGDIDAYQFPGCEWKQSRPDDFYDILMNDDELSTVSTSLVQRRRESDEEVTYEFNFEVGNDHTDTTQDYRLRVAASVDDERKIFENTREQVLEQYEVEQELDEMERFGFA